MNAYECVIQDKYVYHYASMRNLSAEYRVTRKIT